MERLAVDNKFKFLWILWIFLLIFGSSGVSGLGITPAKKVVDFEEGLNYGSDFKVINTANSSREILIEVRGELGKYVVLQGGSYYSVDANSEKIVKYSIMIPSNIKEKDLPVGNNDVHFIVKELVKADSNSIGVSVGLITTLRVRVPYWYKYVVSELYIYEGDVGSNTIFVIPIENLGASDLDNVRAVIKIKGGGKIVDEIKSEDISILSGERKEIRVVWQTLVEPGAYLADVFLEYDSEVNKLEGEFFIEGAILLVEKLSVGDVSGDVARFETKVKNVWNGEVRDVYAEIEVYDNDRVLIGSFVTQSESIDKGDEKIFAGYIDITNLSYGEYTTRLVLHYGSKNIERFVDTTFYDDQFTVGVMETSTLIEANSGGNLTFYLITGLILLLAINLVWFLIFKRKR